MCVMEIQNQRGTEKWICFKHPDGQYVTQRKATDDDLEKIDVMVQSLKVTIIHD